MLPAHLYTPLFYHTMLLVVIVSVISYCVRPKQAASLHHIAMVLLVVGVILFIGFRPVSGVFIDMVGYAWTYERVQQGAASGANDLLFNGLMQLCAPFLPVEWFFLVCSLIYVAPLALAFWRIHGAWAFPVFLACLTAFSFWPYGVNGIRNGMATSVLILAFAFHDKPVLMLPLMAAAWGLHGSVLLPTAAFLIVRYVQRTEIWLVLWVLCAIASLFGGNIGDMLLNRYNPVAWDARAESYIHSVGSGFRADFVAYSILPVALTILMAAPTRARTRRLIGKLTAGWSRTGNWPALVPKPAVAGYYPSTRQIRAGLGGAQFSISLARQKLNQGTITVPGQPGWASLPWIRFLHADPFYARLLNTYLLANAMWVLVINTSFSNRFAYLSWFMMPWVLLYPFVSGKVIQLPRAGVIAATLLAHYLFTYLMVFVIYPLRGGGGL